jgi:DNA-binding cell septation regulator SpoVG|tara:strand:- start:513 stop:896 length:384 start_codon:yes stop_codon:yes gene_type:complete
MVKVYALREHGWFENQKLESFIWKQTKNAFGVDNVILENSFESIDEEETTKVFLVMPNRIDKSVELKDFVHPKNASYIFGNAVDNLVRFIGDDDKAVHITTHQASALFGVTVVGAVMFDRMSKNGNR